MHVFIGTEHWVPEQQQYITVTMAYIDPPKTYIHIFWIFSLGPF